MPETNCRNPRPRHIQSIAIALTLASLTALFEFPRAVKSESSPSPTLTGQKVTDFSAKDYRGRMHTLSEYSDSKVVVLAFLGTECPLAKQYGPRLGKIAQDYQKKGVTILGINANRHDSITEIASYARRHVIGFPILKDLGNRIADLVGARRTPEILVLDENRTVRYHGRVDDQYGIGYIRDEPKQQFLRDAIDDLLASRKVRTPSSEVIGCFIGRVREPQSNSSVTFSNQIVRILNRHCVECHREGEIAPFSLTNYDEVVGWGETMVEVIHDGRMPPWHANPDHGEFLNARIMTDLEKRQLEQWVDAGCPEGNPADLPDEPEFISGWMLPREPDLVVNMRDQPYVVPAEGTVRYQYFRVDPGFKEDKWVKAAELQPGNRSVVHHILVFAAPPGGRGRGNSSTTGEFLAAYVPGYRAPIFPDGMAKHIPAGSQLVFQLHYTPIGTEQQDMSRLGLVFVDSEKENIENVVITRQAANRRGLVIPPHAENHRVEARSETAPSDVQILGFMPHMHLRGKSFRYEARYPDGGSRILLDVPAYDFNWQTAYRTAKPVSLPKGAFLQCVAHFDNSENNLSNPDPSATVRWGDQTWEEMMIGYFDVAIPADVLGFGSGDKSRDSDSGNVTINGQATSVTSIIEAIRKLDQSGNRNGKLEKSEVPARHLRLYNRLDADNDGVLTVDEAHKTIRSFRGR